MVHALVITRQKLMKEPAKRSMTFLRCHLAFALLPRMFVPFALRFVPLLSRRRMGASCTA